MPVLTSTAEMNELATKLAKMKFAAAVTHLRWMDKHVRVDMYRISVNYNELHTRYALPERGLWVTLIERKENKGEPDRLGHIQQTFKFVEARVEPIPADVREDKQLAE